VFVAFSTNQGASFSVQTLVTPGTDDTNEFAPNTLLLHPQTGLPHLTFVRSWLQGGAGTEIMFAEWVPSP